jgi:type 1 glutamine amidotransferase
MEKQPAIMVAGYGKGRIFHTILGHDLKAMESEGFQMLMLRGTEWAATGKVLQKLSSESK